MKYRSPRARRARESRAQGLTAALPPAERLDRRTVEILPACVLPSARRRKPDSRGDATPDRAGLAETPSVSTPGRAAFRGRRAPHTRQDVRTLGHLPGK